MPRAFSFFPLICHKNVYTICMMMHCYLNIHTWSKCKKLQKKTPSKMYRFLWKSASVDRKPKVCWTKTTFTSGWPPIPSRLDVIVSSFLVGNLWLPWGALPWEAWHAEWSKTKSMVCLFHYLFVWVPSNEWVSLLVPISFCMYTLFQKKFPIVCDQFESHQQKSIRGYSSTLLENNFDWSGFQNWIYFYTLVQWGKLWRILIWFIHLVNSVCMIVSLRK